MTNSNSWTPGHAVTAIELWAAGITGSPLGVSPSRHDSPGSAVDSVAVCRGTCAAGW